METNELSARARGGTELMLQALHARLDPELLQQFQIIPSRVRSLDSERKRILWLHNKPCREESSFLEQAERRAEFAGIVCVSHYQAALYQMIPGVPYSDMIVLQNAIEPFDAYVPRRSERIRLIYHTTPDRGLEILVPVFEFLATRHPDIELDVYSSFSIYDWTERDKPYQALFERCRAHPRIRYHGAQPNAVVRDTLSRSDIFAYPNIEPETSCIAAIEAMSAGCLTVCAAYGGLPETCANFARLYPFSENMQDHAQRFATVLDDAILTVRQRRVEDEYLRTQQVEYFTRFYSWDRRAREWDAYLRSLL
ncbi:glycosyltransferase family 4 protein [Paraburkholderia sp. C35]|uniref:glycosyltransferase family 4 protein n=1 Tax=Paraburkholderia sp. C35 TaxID=2126993 RepID=UPI000D69A37A|nr:glycosyltransferase family 4 protein [Paraburkholderia sp. C35]